KCDSTAPAFSLQRSWPKSMRAHLAERLLAAVMGWRAEDIGQERPFLQEMASFKYDNYQQYSPGMRFVESLALWLDQFRTREERAIAYEFFKRQLVYLSDREIVHFGATAFPDLVRPFLIGKAAQVLGCSDSLVARIAASREYRLILRQSLIRSLHGMLSQPATVRYCCPHQLMGNKGGRHVRTLEASRQSCQRLSDALCHCRFRLPTRTSAWLAPELVWVAKDHSGTR